MIVSIHAPVGGATRCNHPQRILQGVSIHAPVGGRDIMFLTRWSTLMFQSTRPRGARLDLSVTTLRITVSIHAPVGGATVFLLSFCIHAACIGLFVNCCRSIVITTISLALFSYNMLTFNLRDLVYFSCNATHSLNYMINSASTL